MKPGETQAKATCPFCGVTCAVTARGVLRIHPQSPAAPCDGAGQAPDRPPPAGTTRLEADGYRAAEPMMAAGQPCPPGHAVVTIVMHVPVDPDRTCADEAALLYEDPAHLYRVMDATPNRMMRLTLAAVGESEKALP